MTSLILYIKLTGKIIKADSFNITTWWQRSRNKRKKKPKRYEAVYQKKKNPATKESLEAFFEMSDEETNEATLVRRFTTYQVTPPSKFPFKSSDWTRWIRRFERFRIATGLDKKEEDKQVNTLIYSMGDEADDIVSKS